MDQTPRENLAEYLLLGVSIIPGMIAAGFFPAWDVLPFGAWLAIATLGAAVAGAIATPRWWRGLVAGLVAGAGIFAGIGLYVALRAALSGGAKVHQLEIGLAGLLGYAPGFALFYAWARGPAPPDREPWPWPGENPTESGNGPPPARD